MFLRRSGLMVVWMAATVALLFGLVNLGAAQASSSVLATVSTMGPNGQATLQQTMPMSPTMPMHGTTSGDMPMDDAMPGKNALPPAVPMQPETGPGGSGHMMATMAKMQGMMASMQGMMAEDMMSSEMPMSGEMHGNMGEMMAMMSEMQGMMAEMQGMMAAEMMGDDMPMPGQMQGLQTSGGMMGNSMPMPGQMQGQQVGGGMLGNTMPMMGTVIVVMPMPMNGIMGMMGQMPMMQDGMDMDGMMGGQDSPRRDFPTTPADDDDTAATPQTGRLGAIEVKVTPPDLNNVRGETIDFTVDLNATGTDLTPDLSKLASLRIGDQEMSAMAWEVAFDHGHHVNGVLKFSADTAGAVERAVLTIADPNGGPALTMTWPVAK